MSLMELQSGKRERVYTRRQTSAEIVSEARRSLRSLATQRPFTPQEKHRQLFGESSSRTHDARPPSTFSLHARNFEAPDSRPGSGTRLSPLERKSRPSVSLDENEAALPKPPPDRGNTRRPPGGSRARLIRTPSINRLPPMTSHTTILQHKGSEMSVEVKTDQIEDRERPHCADVTGNTTNTTSESDQHTFIKHSRVPQSVRPDVSSASKPGLSAVEAQRERDDENRNTDEFVVLPGLREIESFTSGDGVSEEIVGRLCDACAELHRALEERCMLGRQCKKRSNILRSLFRLIDVGSDRLNLTLADLILALNVSGNNLLNICKLVFKVSRNSSNDALFLSSSILDSLLSLLQCEDVWSRSEAVLYCVGSLKLLSGNSALSSLLLGKDFIRVLLQLSKRLIHSTSSASSHVTNHRSEEGQQTIAGHILVQVTAALRNVADLSESRPNFLSTRSFSTLCWILENHRCDLDICVNVARIFSKLSTYTECCYALAETPRCCCLFLELLAKHSRKQELVVRLLFTLGNLTAKSNEARERVYEEEGGINVLVDLFQMYQTFPSPSEQLAAPERDDVLVKLIRLLANLAIHCTVGTSLAANALCVQLLLQVLESRCVQESEELVVNTVATINNLSFYQSESSVVRSQHRLISQLLLKLLLGPSMEGVLEATRVFGNLSQIKDVRRFIMEHKVHQFVVTLLDSKNPDVCFSACGVLINLSADQENRATLRAEGTTRKLIDCLRVFGSQDWHLAAVLCQNLWNCSSDAELQPSEDLLEILQIYTDRELLQWPSDDGVRQVQEACWELLFLPVAERLKQRLHTEDMTGISQ